MAICAKMTPTIGGTYYDTLGCQSDTEKGVIVTLMVLCVIFTQKIHPNLVLPRHPLQCQLGELMV